MLTMSLVSPTSAAILDGSRSRNQEDIDRVQRTQQGSVEAFEELICAYQEPVYNQAYWMLGDQAAAEDAAQEAFFRAYSKIRTFDGDSFRAWIMRITTNYCLDHIRRSKRHPLISLEAPCTDDDDDRAENSVWMIDPRRSPEQIVEQADRRALIHRCLMALSPRDREPIILVDIQEMDYQEAAKVMNIPLGSFKSRLFRARARLIELINRAPGVDQLLN